MQCKQLLFIRRHGSSLWINNEYPIHAIDIKRLTSLSVGGDVISTTFMKTSKRGKKTGDDNYYTNYDTKRGGKGAGVYFINSPKN